MDRLFVMSRARDHKRVEFYSEIRNDKKTFIIREVGLTSQDSVTTDPDAMEIYRQRLLGDGYMQTSF
jgi:hypothetical protein